MNFLDEDKKREKKRDEVKLLINDFISAANIHFIKNIACNESPETTCQLEKVTRVPNNDIIVIPNQLNIQVP